jgi:DNA invertase Pin-like site-specific DNA recombinase
MDDCKRTDIEEWNGSMNKFTNEQVIQIRKLAQRGKSYRQIARDFDCSLAAISYICRGLLHKDVSGPIQAKQISRKLTEEQVIQIRTLYKSGAYSQRDLARDFNVSAICIYCIVNRKTYRWVR